jgi:hypothetical protein
MDNQTLLYIMTAFVVIAGISLFLQLLCMLGMYLTLRALQGKVTAMLPKVESLVDASQKAVVEGKQQILEITAKANEIMDSAKRQLAKVEDVVNDATGRAKVQMDRAEMVLDDTMTRAHDTVALVHGGVMRPLREIHGVAAGLRATLLHLASGGRSTSVAQATQDEEMFI